MSRCAFSSRSVRSDNEWQTVYVLRLTLPLPGNKDRTIPPEENALPARTDPPFRHGNYCFGAGQLIYLAGGFCLPDGQKLIISQLSEML